MAATRFIIFDEFAQIVAQHQVEFTQYYPHPGWHEHDPEEIIETVRVCISEAVKNLEKAGWAKQSVKTIGITNQRETTVAWDKKTGKSLCRAIVWDDARTKGTVAHFTDKLNTEGIEHRVPVPPTTGDGKAAGAATASTKDTTETRAWGPDAHAVVRSMTGLPISTYFSAIKLRWMLQHHESVQRAHEEDTLLFGTVDSWICYNLLTPPESCTDKSSKVHITDPSNASRTLLYDLASLSWSPTLLSFFDLRPSILPKLVSSSEVYGHLDTSTALPGVSVAGMAGDQQAALVGNKCLIKGDAKCTYGTGAFLLFCTGDKVVRSGHGLLSTVAFQYPTKDAKINTVYALEGSIGVAGSAIKWLRDGLGLIKSTAEINTLAASVEDTGGIFFVTAFGGLLAPYWDPSAAGTLIGLTSYTKPGHIARATLAASAYQTRAILESMHLDAEHRDDERKELKVDGGMTNGDVAMQILADVVGYKILRPEMRESTALGSALLAGSAVGLYGWDLSKPETFAKVNSQGSTTFSPAVHSEAREARWKQWQRAVERSKGWDQNVEE